jgi:hypothetical protein
MLMTRQALAFVGVVHVQYRTVVGHIEARGNRVHSVCAPVVVG